jgi:AcrR family transcriptional regulator
LVAEPAQIRRESTDERRAAIAGAARAIIVERGFEGLRMRDIAERVGINVATLHYHVPAKETLIQLVAQNLKAEFRAQAERRPRRGLNGLELLRTELADFRETVTEMPDLIVVMTELMERARRDPSIAAIMRPMRQFWAGQFEAIFDAGKADGTLEPGIDSKAAAQITVGALSDYWRMSRSLTLPVDAVTAQLERCFRNHSA